MTESYDVIVVGVGGMGSAAACELASRGLRVLGLEQFTPGHDRGSSHGQTRIVRQSYFESPAYLPLLRRAYEHWDALPVELGLRRVGCLTIGAADSGVVRGVEVVARQGVAVEPLTRAETMRRFPAFRLGPDEVAGFEPDAGFVRPEPTVRWYADQAVARGAKVQTGVRVTGWDAEPDHVTVHADGERWTARRLVLAPGAWAPRLARRLELPIRVRRRVMHFFGPAGPDEHLRAPSLPTYIWEIAPGDAIYGFPLDHGTAKVGFHHRGDLADPERPQPDGSDDEISEMREALRDRMPSLAGPWVRSVGCMYALTPDEHFVLGLAPGLGSTVIIAAGFSGHGFKFVPVVGEILADLVVDGATPYDIGFLSPARFTER